MTRNSGTSEVGGFRRMEIEPMQNVTEGRDALNRTMGIRIQAAREEAALSQDELARAIGVTPRLLAKVEAGRARLDVPTLIAATDTLGVSTDYVYGLE